MKKILTVLLIALISLMPVCAEEYSYEYNEDDFIALFIVYSETYYGIHYDDLIELRYFANYYLTKYYETYPGFQDTVEKAIGDTIYVFNNSHRLIFNPELIKCFRYIVTSFSREPLVSDNTYSVSLFDYNDVSTMQKLDLHYWIQPKYGADLADTYNDIYVLADNQNRIYIQNFYQGLFEYQMTSNSSTTYTADYFQLNIDWLQDSSAAYHARSRTGAPFLVYNYDLNNGSITFNCGSYDWSDYIIYVYTFDKGSQNDVTLYNNVITNLTTAANPLIMPENKYTSLYDHANTDYTVSGNKYVLLYIALRQPSSAVLYSYRFNDGNDHTFYLFQNFTGSLNCSSKPDFINSPLSFTNYSSDSTEIINVGPSLPSITINGESAFGAEHTLDFETGTILPNLYSQNNIYGEVQGDYTNIDFSSLVTSITSDLTADYNAKFYDIQTQQEINSSEINAIDNAIYNLINGEPIDYDDTNLTGIGDDIDDISNMVDDYNDNIDSFIEALDPINESFDSTFFSTLQWFGTQFVNLIQINTSVFAFLIFVLTLLVISVILR